MPGVGGGQRNIFILQMILVLVFQGSCNNLETIVQVQRLRAPNQDVRRAVLSPEL